MDEQSNGVGIGGVGETVLVVEYPIAETFDSIQGEGEHAGRRMFFIRMAGCSVGKKNPQNEIYETCQTVTGAKFTCDTDYRFVERKSLSELLSMIPEGVGHVCITGGEPLNQNLPPLIEALAAKGIMTHIETSGTVVPRYWARLVQEDLVWLTCSPKIGAKPEIIDIAHEIKLLIDRNFEEAHIPLEVLKHPNLFVQPVNNIYTVDQSTLKKAIDFITKYPHVRLSTQMHKTWRVR